MKSFPIYTLAAVRSSPFLYDGLDRVGSGRARDPRGKGKACLPKMRIPIFKVVLRKEGSLRVPRTKIEYPEQAHEVAYALIGDRPFEYTVAIYLSSHNDITGATIVGTSGSVASSPASIRGVFTGALVHNAVGIILAHNHPSGNPAPSADDIEVTKKMRAAAEILGIPILDHLIVTRDPAVWRSVTC